MTGCFIVCADQFDVMTALLQVGNGGGRNSAFELEGIAALSPGSAATIADLKQRGHDVELIGAYDEATGHAGAIIRYGNGVLEGAADPRSDGCVAGY